MERHGVMEVRGAVRDLMPTTFQTAVILGIWAAVSIIVIDYLYKKRGE